MPAQTHKTEGTRNKETKNAVVFQSGWGPVYVPKTVDEQLGNPTNVVFTVTNNDEATS